MLGFRAMFRVAIQALDGRSCLGLFFLAIASGCSDRHLPLSTSGILHTTLPSEEVSLSVEIMNPIGEPTQLVGFFDAFSNQRVPYSASGIPEGSSSQKIGLTGLQTWPWLEREFQRQSQSLRLIPILKRSDGRESVGIPIDVACPQTTLALRPTVTECWLSEANPVASFDAFASPDVVSIALAETQFDLSLRANRSNTTISPDGLRKWEITISTSENPQRSTMAAWGHAREAVCKVVAHDSSDRSLGTSLLVVHLQPTPRFDLVADHVRLDSSSGEITLRLRQRLPCNWPEKFSIDGSKQVQFTDLRSDANEKLLRVRFERTTDATSFFEVAKLRLEHDDYQQELPLIIEFDNLE